MPVILPPRPVQPAVIFLQPQSLWTMTTIWTMVKSILRDMATGNILNLGVLVIATGGSHKIFKVNSHYKTKIQRKVSTIKLECYWETFKSNGYDMIEILSLLTESKLNDIFIGILGGHRAFRLVKIKQMVN